MDHPAQKDQQPGALPLLVHRDHRRTYAENFYVYPVVSRRSKGVSIGVNLNPDKVCNFDCVYCQVDRRTPGPTRDVDLARLGDELEEMLDRVRSGRLFEEDRFRETPEHLRRLNDIAFSGDGEPTTCPEFPEIVQAVATIKRRRGLDAVKLLLITNATMLHRDRVQQGLRTLFENNGEVWAKLEAGTEEYYRQVDRTTIPFQRILDNITEVSRAVPVVIQALFMRLHGTPPPADELAAFCDRLNEILRAGGQIKLVQIYTVARKPAEDHVAPLSAAEVDAIVDLVHRHTGLVAEPFYQ
jgi:wyosine [tRNA(Phe)-imidazoG37] synthetase (radical SAM superfamily)